MLRTFVAVSLLATVTLAQLPAVEGPPGHQKNSLSHPLKATAYHSQDVLRRGTDETIAVVVEGAGFVTSPRSPVAEVVPITLQLDEADGLTFSAIDYPKPYKHKFSGRQEPVPVFQFPWQQLRFKLRAAPDAALGIYELTGRILLQSVSEKGPAQVQEISVQIPVTIADRNAQVRRTSSFPSQNRTPPWNDMPLGIKIVLVPLLVPLTIVEGVVCFARGEDCSC